MNRQLAKQYFDRAEALLTAGRPEEALTLLNQLDEAFPDTKNIGVTRARAYASMGRVSDAVQLCDELIERHDSRRAQELKKRLVFDVLDPVVAKPAIASVSRGRIRRVSSVVLLATACMAMIGAALWFARRIDSDLVGEAESSNSSANAVSPSRMVSQPSTPIPGQVHARFTWELDDAGVPKWKSGVFERVPGINDPKRTINVYLPLAYDEKPNEKFPGVIISMPAGNPSFLGLESWAERQEVILIGLNSSRNGPSSNNIEAQDTAFETFTPTLRVNQEMGFAIGSSGGAMASWLVASRYPDNFRGVVMMGQGGFESRMLAPHIRVAYIRGIHEPNNWYIPRVIAKLKANGNDVRDRLVPGGHVMGPVPVRVEMLNWMVYAARRDLGLPQPSR